MNNPSYKDYIRQENEFTRLKIQAEYGLDVSHYPDINPAIENIFLKNVLEFEKGMVNNKQVPLVELLGHPSFRRTEEVSDEELHIELRKALEMMQEKRIVVDSAGKVSDREMYRFITEELMHVEVDSFLPKNVIYCFMYEEFHPDEEENLRIATTAFLSMLTRKDIGFDVCFFFGDGEEQTIYFDLLIRKLTIFRDAFERVEVEEEEILEVEFTGGASVETDFPTPAEMICDDGKTAAVRFRWALGLYTSAGSKKHTLSGIGKLTYCKKMGTWFVTGVEMNGVV